MRQAVVIIHGIGEQRPMETLRAFVAGALGVEKKTLEDLVFSKPDRISDTLELRRLSAPPRNSELPRSKLQPGCETDFYELYWQHLMEGTGWFHVWPWTLSLLCRRKLTPRLKPIRRSLALMVLLIVVIILALTAGVSPWLENSPLWQWVAGSTVLVGLGWLVWGPIKWFLISQAGRFVLGVVGDAARYLTPDPPNIKARREIRTAGLELLRGLHEDKLRRYERIIVVGHSLGSVIAYDLITWFWQEQHHRVDLEHLANRREIVLTEPFPPHISKRNGPSPLDALSQASGCDEVRQRQWTMWWKLHRTKGLPWRITDLVTLGSPLAHAEVLLAESKEAFEQGKRQREFPTCPPQKEDARDFGLLRRKCDQAGCPPEVRILHHGAPFAVTRWTNLFFPGDIIGGPVAPLFGSGIKDVCLCPDAGDRRIAASVRSHTHYWDPGEKRACEELAQALQLNEAKPELAPAHAQRGSWASGRRLLQRLVRRWCSSSF
jgi:hypothetical protein